MRSSISKLPDNVISCNNSIIKTISIIVNVKTFILFCFLNNTGRKNANGIQAIIFPTIFVITALLDIFLKFLLSNVYLKIHFYHKIYQIMLKLQITLYTIQKISKY